MVKPPIHCRSSRIVTLVQLLALSCLGVLSIAADAEQLAVKSAAVNEPVERLNALQGQEDYFALMKELGIRDRLDLPQLFVSGDSISQHYAPSLKAALNGKLNVTHWMDLPERYPKDVPKTPYSGTTDLLLEMLNAVLESKAYHPQFLLLNAGLHDATYQYTPEAHRTNLIKIVELVDRYKVPMVWVTTTPREKGDPHNPLINAYNVEARKVMHQHEVPVIELDKFTANLIAKDGDKEIYNGDGLHFSTKVRNKMGQFIADDLLKILKNELTTAQEAAPDK